MANGTDTNQLSVGVIGMGAIGSTLAAHLIDAGAHVIACDVDREKIDAMKADGICLEGKIRKKVGPVDGCYSVQQLGARDFDLAIVAVKTPILVKVVSVLSESLPAKTFVMCAQNGLDNEMEVAKIVGEKRTLRMSINFAGGMTAPNTMNVIFFNPPNYVAAMTPEGEVIVGRFADLLNSQDLETEIPEDIRVHTWKKAILNSALSPVCAITRRTMKGVMDFPEGQEMATSILKESIRVAEAEGIDCGEDFLEYCIYYLQQGGPHKPSMLVDLENGLMTEIDYLNGKIAQIGTRHGVPTPYNTAITAFIHMLELSSK